MKRFLILLCIILALSGVTLGIDIIGYTGTIYVNDTSLVTNGTFLRDGESEFFNVTLVMNGKGNYILGSQVNSTANGTAVYSNRVNVTIYGATPIMPLCTERLTSDPMCNNNTYNGTFLREGQSELFTIDIFIDANVPVPSNWTLSAFVNSTANGTEVKSNSVIIEVTSEVTTELSVTINQPTNISYTNKTVLFDVASVGDELKDCWYDIGSGDVSYTCNSTFQLYLSEGSYYFTAYANQTNGSETSANVSFNVDTYPVWSNNVSTLSGMNYNPQLFYSFNITFTDVIDLANISFYWQGSLFSTENYTSTLSATVSNNFTTLGAGNYSYYWIGCDRMANCNTTDTWVYEVRKADTTSYAYIDSLRANKTYTYNPSEHTILSNGTTNLTALLYLDGTSITNGTDIVFGAGLFNVTVINEGNTNYTGSTETWLVRVNQHPSSTYLFIDNATLNVTKTYGLNTNISAYNTNATLSLWINGSNTLNTSYNVFIGILGAGRYNITAYSVNNTNYSGSNQMLWLNVTQKGTEVIMTADGTRGNIFAQVEEVINFTVTLKDVNGTLLTNNVGWYNNFSGSWVLHNTSASPLYNSTNLIGFATGLYLFGGSFSGNTNYSASGENWTMEVTDFNLTVTYSCNISEFTYNTTSGWVYNQTINMTNGTGGDTGLNDFRQVNLWDVKVTNMTSGNRVSIGNWTVNGRYIRAYNNVSYANKLVNVTYYYVYKSITNNTQKRIEPRWQNDTCGIFNVTLNTAGSNSNGTLKAKIIGAYIPNATIKLSNVSNYTLAISLNNNTYVSLFNLTRGTSYMWWHWLDLNGTKWGTNLTHTIDFHMFTEGS
ncbi:hypothetical protein M0R04_11250 [Candidatus Dojkabacteria bacterium]|jgi:hypothetical protein|nr:hypothetical protein [Candidatus Dojkabacteria bacterium]